MSKISRENLSERDRAVMDSIFGHTQSGSQIPYYDQEELEELKDEEGELTAAVQQSIKTELEAIQAAERGALEQATDMFEIAIQLAPHRAAPYNNRAQVYRMQEDNDGELWFGFNPSAASQSFFLSPSSSKTLETVFAPF